MEKTEFDIKSAIQEQLEALVNCDDEIDVEIISRKLEILLAVYSVGIFRKSSIDSEISGIEFFADGRSLKF